MFPILLMLVLLESRQPWKHGILALSSEASFAVSGNQHRVQKSWAYLDSFFCKQ